MPAHLVLLFLANCLVLFCTSFQSTNEELFDVLLHDALGLKDYKEDTFKFAVVQSGFLKYLKSKYEQKRALGRAGDSLIILKKSVIGPLSALRIEYACREYYNNNLLLTLKQLLLPEAFSKKLVRELRDRMSLFWNLFDLPDTGVPLNNAAPPTNKDYLVSVLNSAIVSGDYFSSYEDLPFDAIGLYIYDVVSHWENLVSEWTILDLVYILFEIVNKITSACGDSKGIMDEIEVNQWDKRAFSAANLILLKDDNRGFAFGIGVICVLDASLSSEYYKSFKSYLQKAVLIRIFHRTMMHYGLEDSFFPWSSLGHVAEIYSLEYIFERFVACIFHRLLTQFMDDQEIPMYVALDFISNRMLVDTAVVALVSDFLTLPVSFSGHQVTGLPTMQVISDNYWYFSKIQDLYISPRFREIPNWFLLNRILGHMNSTFTKSPGKFLSPFYVRLRASLSEKDSRDLIELEREAFDYLTAMRGILMVRQVLLYSREERFIYANFWKYVPFIEKVCGQGSYGVVFQMYIDDESYGANGLYAVKVMPIQYDGENKPELPLNEYKVSEKFAASSGYTNVNSIVACLLNFPLYKVSVPARMKEAFKQYCSQSNKSFVTFHFFIYRLYYSTILHFLYSTSLVPRSSNFGDTQEIEIFRGILSGLAELHTRGIVHADLKPANLLYDGHSTCTIGDFGSSYISNDRSMLKQFSFRTAAWYRAPEIFLGDLCFLPAADMWSFGCILYEGIIRACSQQAKCSIAALFEVENSNVHGSDARTENAVINLACIVSKLGPITPRNFPGVENMPLFSTLAAVPNGFISDPVVYEQKMFNFRGISAQLLMYGVDPKYVELLMKCLQYDPSKRISARQALGYFTASA